MGDVRRLFVDTSIGQIHVRVAKPVGPSENPPLVCLHHSPSSGFIFAPILPQLSRRRAVYAPDLPGYGESARPSVPPAIADYTRIVAEALDQLEPGPIDLLGYHTGASVAAEWVSIFPGRVRRLILVGAPLFTPEVRELMLATPWPGPPAEDGSHLVAEWQRVMSNHRLPLSLESKSAIFHEMFRGGATAHWGGEAVGRHDLAAALAKVDVPTLILETPDYLRGSGPKIQALVRNSEWRDWQHLGHGLYEGATGEVAAEIEAYLDSA